MQFLRLFFFRRLPVVTVALALTVSGCGVLGAGKKKPKLAKPDVPNMADQNGDTSFQGFVVRLRKAADKRDSKMLSTMMAADFGYSWAPGGEGAGVFDYWTRNNLWPEVSRVLKERFVPNGNFMVAPRQVTVDPDFNGYRAGVKLVSGAWRFCYFVPAPPAPASAPASASAQ